MLATGSNTRQLCVGGADEWKQCTAWGVGSGAFRGGGGGGGGGADEQILVTPWYKCQVALAVCVNAHVFYLACKFYFCVAL